MPVFSSTGLPIEDPRRATLGARSTGIAAIVTTNRSRLSLRGYESELDVRFYGWLPATVKESFVFRHVYYDPSLANYDERRTVQWFSYADLCAEGVFARFSQFTHRSISSTSGKPIAAAAPRWVVCIAHYCPGFGRLPGLEHSRSPSAAPASSSISLPPLGARPSIRGA